MVMTTPSSVSHWSRYWQAGARTSLPQDFAANYAGELAQFWQDQFAALPATARILDLCCGNGPIAVLAAQYSQQHALSFEITAADAAQLLPEAVQLAWPDQVQALAAIRFLSETAAEALPVFQPPLDLICSQYGLEYCDLTAVAPRLWANLAPGGHLVMVSHAPHSEVLRTMQAEQRDYQMLDTHGALRLLLAWQRKQLSDADFVARLQKTGQKLAALRPRSALLDSVLQAMSALIRMPVSQRQHTHEQAGQYRDELLAAQQRAGDLLAVMDHVADEQWLVPLHDIGLRLCSTQSLSHRGEHPLGVARVWQRPPA